MFPDHHDRPYFADRLLRPDRRPPRASEIRLRVKRASTRQEA